ncbi:MAG: transaldolase [Planctomycetota bacterium]|nr:transaldolase [Planctomycetota bacterium]
MTPENNPLRRLRALGQSAWLDFLGRGLLDSGELERLVREDGLSGVTSNPAIFEKAIAGSHDYDEAIARLAAAGKAPAEIYETLTVEDVQRAADVLRPVYESTGRRDGYVSLEVSPHLAEDTDGTVAEARRLWGELARPNVFIKIPATMEGLPAIRRCIGEGINVNVTLLFGLPRYRKVAEAYLDGLQDLAAKGGRLDTVASVASFFLSRIDTLVDPMLEKIAQEGGPHAGHARTLVGQVALASAKMAYTIHREIFKGERFRSLARGGARPQNLLWASTSTKNPAYSDVKYVEPLIGPDTINTLPTETIKAYRDHGKPAMTLPDGTAEAWRAMARLAQAGIDIDAVTAQLEREGLDKFVQPYDSLLEALHKKCEALGVHPVGAGG